MLINPRTCELWERSHGTARAARPQCAKLAGTGRASIATCYRPRTERLAAASGLDADRLAGWCGAFASMIALELASQGAGPGARMDALLELASRA